MLLNSAAASLISLISQTVWRGRSRGCACPKGSHQNKMLGKKQRKKRRQEPAHPGLTHRGCAAQSLHLQAPAGQSARTPRRIPPPGPGGQPALGSKAAQCKEWESRAVQAVVEQRRRLGKVCRPALAVGVRSGRRSAAQRGAAREQSGGGAAVRRRGAHSRGRAGCWEASGPSAWPYLPPSIGK